MAIADHAGHFLYRWREGSLDRTPYGKILEANPTKDHRQVHFSTERGPCFGLNKPGQHPVTKETTYPTGKDREFWVISK